MNALTPSQGVPAPLSPAPQAPAPNAAGSVQFGGYLLTGFLLIIALVGGFAAWSILAPIQGAVLATGSVVVEGKPKTIQHLDGGIVSEIFVKDGDAVTQGDVVIRLDSTALNSNKDLLRRRLDEALARKHRLQSERDGKRALIWGTVFDPDANARGKADIIDDQTKLFNARRDARGGERSQLQKQIQQFGDQITGLNAQITADGDQLSIIEQELGGLRTLFSEGYVAQSRVLALERESASLKGRIASYNSDIARINSQASATELEILQLGQTLQEAVLTELRQTESEISDLREQLLTATDQARRIDITAPVTGIVHNMSITTIGGVVTPANPIMDIIPAADRLIVETQVEPASIDQIYIGQPTTIRLSAFNQRTTPELNGDVMGISANTLQDPTTGMTFYTVKVQIPADELSRLKGLVLVPGMPAEAFMQTDKRSAMSYLLKPATDQLNRAFREE